MDICLGSFAIGSFTATPILTGHSALDTYMLLVEGTWKSCFISATLAAVTPIQQRTADAVRRRETAQQGRGEQ
jgi:hypothetical protein